MNFAHSDSWMALLGLMLVPSIAALLILWLVARPSSLQVLVVVLVLLLPTVGLLGLCRWALTVDPRS